MKIEIEITMDMILNHFPEHNEQDIQKALKTPKLQMLYGLKRKSPFRTLFSGDRFSTILTPMWCSTVALV